MPENFGGLDYAINVVGDWEARLADFNAQIDNIDKKSRAASARVGTTGKGKESTGALDREAVIQKKLLALERQLITLGSSRVQTLQRVAEVTSTTARQARRSLTTEQQANRTFKQRQVIAKFLHDQEIKRTAASASAAKKEIARRNVLRSAQQTQLNLLKAESLEREKIATQVQKTKSGLNNQRTAEFDKAHTQAIAIEKSKQKAARFDDTTLQATQRNNVATRELSIKHAQINQLMRDQGISMRAAADQVGISSAQAKQLKLDMFDASHAARQFLFTFRRLVGILAIFTAARKIAQALGSAVKEMSRFNAELETAEIGIASIVASVGEVRDSSGNLVTGQEAFAVALNRSKGIVQELKKEAIGSIATFEALVKSYQVAIGPGLAAGLDLNQIKLVSKRLAEGALSLGVPLNQLSEEIRSLLQGTATARNTRIAVLFGGAKEANEAIRNAKEQGNLFDVLTDKFGGIEQGARAAAFSLNVLKSNLQDTVQVLLAEGGIEQFNQVKDATLALSDALVSVDAEGGFIFTPEALGLVQEIAGTLASVTQSFRDLSDTSSILATFRNLLGTVGDVLRAIAPVAVALFQGILDGVNSLLAPVRLVGVLLRKFADVARLQKVNKLLAQAVKFVVSIAVGLFIWKKVLTSIPVLYKDIVFRLGLIAFNLKKAVITQALMQAQLLGITVGTQAWSILLTGVVLKMALLTGGIGAVLIGVGFLAVKFGLVDKLTGSFNNELSDADKTALDLEHSISSAAEGTAAGARSAEDWASALREASSAANIAEALEGVEGLSKDILSIIEEETAAYKDRNRVALEAEKIAKKAKDAVEDEVKAIEDAGGIVFDIKFREVSAEEAQSKLIDFQNELAGVSFPPLFVESDEQLGLVSTLARKTQELKDIQVGIVAGQSKTNQIIKDRIRLLLAENSFLEERKDLQVAELVEGATKASTARLNVSVRDLAIAKAKGLSLEAEATLNEKIRSIEKKRLDDRIDGLKEAQKTRELTTQELASLTALEDQRARALDITKAAREADLAALKQITEQIRIQEKLVQGDVSTVVTEGFAAFSRELPALGVQVSEILTGSLTDLAGVIADTFKDAIDPRTIFHQEDLEEAFGEFFLNLAGQFVEAITADLIAKGISQLGLGAEVPQEIATNSNTLALDRNTAALETARLVSTGAPGAPVAPAIPVPDAGGGGEAASSAGAKTGGILGGIANASPILLTILLPILIALITQAFKKGGKVKGYASGGKIGGDIPRPSSIPASDTVPAWLTPGEFVIKKDAVKKYGMGMLTSLNNGVLNPRSFSATGLALGGVAKGIQHFASGGGVSRASQTASKAQQPQTIIVPVQVASNDNMEQMVAGGRKAFNGNVNKAPRYGDPNASRGW